MKNIPIRHSDTIPGEPGLSEKFSIRDVRKLLGGQTLVQQLHRHNYFFILALSKGKGRHDIDFTSYKIGDHSFFFIRQGQVHQLTLGAGSSGYLLQFTPDFYYSGDKSSVTLLRKAGNRNHCRPDAAGAKKLFAVLDTISREFSSRQEGYLDVIRASLGIFFIELVRQRKNKGSSRDKTIPYMQERIDELQELLQTNIAEQKQVSQYAAMLNLSPYQLNAITKASLGKTCSALINDQIILEAKRYLLATSSQVKEIAYQLGYEDTSYFIRFFKKHTGYSPEEFRMNFR